MWYVRLGHTHPRHWHVELHMPVSWRGQPTFAPGLQHVDKHTLDRARLAFPGEGELIFKGCYFSLRGDA